MTPDPEPSAKERIDEVMAFLQYAMQKDFAKTVFDLVAENAALRAEIESHSFEISPAMVQARNDQLYAEVEDLRGIIEKAAGLCQSLAGHRLMQIAQGPRRILSILNAARKTTQP